jgi:GWxTD domain-containing protein
VPAALAALLALANPTLSAWVDGPTGLLATTEERSAYQRLTDDARRALFIESFWARRDPVPSTRVNEFKQQFVERLAQVNEHYAEPGLQGWQTHRGRVYLVLGAPRSDLPRYVPNPDSGAMYPARAWSYGFELLGFESALLFVDTFHNGHYWLLTPVLRPGDLRAVVEAWRNQAAAERFPSVVARSLQRANRRAIQSAESSLESARELPAGSKTTGGPTIEPPPLHYRLAKTKMADRTLLSVTFEVPYRNLVFVEQSGQELCGLSVYAKVLDREGRVQDQATARERFALTKDDLARLADEVYLRVLTLSAPPEAVALELRTAWEAPTPAAESSEVIPLR